jgi:hypothetical protein
MVSIGDPFHRQSKFWVDFELHLTFKDPEMSMFSNLTTLLDTNWILINTKVGHGQDPLRVISERVCRLIEEKISQL